MVKLFTELQPFEISIILKFETVALTQSILGIEHLFILQKDWKIILFKFTVKNIPTQVLSDRNIYRPK